MPSKPSLIPILAAFAFLSALPMARSAEAVKLTLDPSKVPNRIDEKIYGHFLEHIYRSLNGGLWGDVVWNRSFEESPGGGQWSSRDGEIVQASLDANVRLVFGDPRWTDYELTLEARKTGGAEGFLILFRVAPGSLSARSTLDRPDAVRSERVPAKVDGGKVRFEMPPYSVAALAIVRQ